MNNDRHYYLYAKGHYIGTNIKTDLIAIQAKYCNIEQKDVLFHSALTRLLKLVRTHLTDENEFLNFIDRIIKNHSGYWSLKSEKQKLDVAIAHSCLSTLLEIITTDIPFDLGEADPNVLPLKEK